MGKPTYTSIILLVIYLSTCQMTTVESQCQPLFEGFLTISKRGALDPDDYYIKHFLILNKQGRSESILSSVCLLTLSNILGVRSPVTGWIQCNSCKRSGDPRCLTHRLTPAGFGHTFSGAKPNSGTGPRAEVWAGV